MPLSAPLDPVAGNRLPPVVSGPLPEGQPLLGAVLLLGNFDGFHLGHQALLRAARRHAGARPVAVMSCEPHPRSFFGTEPQPFRLATAGLKPHLLAVHGIDYIFAPSFDREFASLLPEAFADQVLVGWLGVSAVHAGPDFRFGRGRSGDMALLCALGRARGFAVGSLAEVTLAGSRASSSAIRDHIRAGDLEAANRLLGEAWLVEVEEDPSGGLRLHPELCRPRPGRYLATQERTGGRPVPVIIDPLGGVHPQGPQHRSPGAGRWRLLAKG